jgi:hypothetical protein
VRPTCSRHRPLLCSPSTYGLASEWLRRAEKLARLPKLNRGIWHPYQRKWATARKHLPLADVAAAGGWKGTQTLTKCYQQPDEATILAVVLGGAELWEKGVPQLIGSTPGLKGCVEVDEVVDLQQVGACSSGG